MNVGYIMEELEKNYPISAAESWDNPGLQVGRRDKEVERIFVALDATNEVIRQAKEWKADLLITHHPLTREGLKKINTDTLIGRKTVELIQADISHYAMHTNFDSVTMGALCGGILGLEDMEVLEAFYTDEKGDPQGFGRVGNLPDSMTLWGLAEQVKDRFSLENVKIFGSLTKIVQRVAILPGSGKDFAGKALECGADVMVSGDFGHHNGIDAVDEGLMIIDAGHYGLEHVFVEYMKGLLEKKFPELQIETAGKQEPFTVL